MNRINKLFQEKNSGLLSLYFCAGHPTVESTGSIIKAIEQNGIDFIEVGIPFSDPMADGPVIQDAATKALRNGMTLRKLFAQITEVRKEGVKLPLILTAWGGHPTSRGATQGLHLGAERISRSCGRQALWQEEEEVPPGSLGLKEKSSHENS